MNKPILQDIILVDESDHQIGTAEKLPAHQQGLLHRAFSVFIFRKSGDELYLLLQQRNFNKYHSAGLWTNTCCSHPHPHEELHTAAKNRLFEEMGITADLTEVGHFIYKAHVGNNLIEHEFDHVFIGFVDNPKIHVNANEVANYRWVEINALQNEFVDSPQKFTAWFKQSFEIAYLHTK